MGGITRRRFIKTGLFGASSVALGFSCAQNGGGSSSTQHPDNDAPPADSDSEAAPPLIESLGVQLYTVRDLMASDLRQTLESVAEIGYEKVEFAGYFDHDPSQIRQWLDALSLSAPAAHHSLEEMQGDVSRIIEDAGTLGHGHLILAWLPVSERSREGYQAVAELLNRTGRAAAASGVKVGYHNHDFDFEPLEDTTGMDILLAETDSSLVDFELDLYWAAFAGVEIASLLERHAGRFTICHLKDIGPDQEMRDVGAGTLDWPVLVDQMTSAGCEHFFVEHDNPEDSLASITNSYRFLS